MNIARVISLMHESGPAGNCSPWRICSGFCSNRRKNGFKGGGEDNSQIQDLINARIAAKKSKNWPEADAIRKNLTAQGIILEDRPDGSTDWRRE